MFLLVSVNFLIKYSFLSNIPRILKAVILYFKKYFEVEFYLFDASEFPPIELYLSELKFQSQLIPSRKLHTLQVSDSLDTSDLFLHYPSINYVCISFATRFSLVIDQRATSPNESRVNHVKLSRKLNILTFQFPTVLIFTSPLRRFQPTTAIVGKSFQNCATLLREFTANLQRI